MDNRAGFSDSKNSNTGSSSFQAAPAPADNTVTSFIHPADILSTPEVSALLLLSSSFESVFDSPESFYSDAKLVLPGGREVSFHRCVLSSRSPSFRRVLSEAKERGGEGTTALKIELKEIAKGYEVSFDSVVAVLAYVYCGRVKPPPKGVSDCVDEDCSHVACRPVVDFLVEVLYLAFAFEIPELVALYQRHLLDTVAKVANDDILVILKVADICGTACKRLVDRCTEIIIKSDVDTVSLDKSLPQHIVKQITKSRKELGLETPEVDINARKIYLALDSDDLELVKWFLEEGKTKTNLDKANALHYAVAYCDAKTAMNLLRMGPADVNHVNFRGYTVLHVAAMRKEPELIMSLLTKGARASDLTLEGITPLQIAKRLTKAADYSNLPVEGMHSPKDRLCIDILKQADRRDPEEASFSLAMAGDDLRMKLLYLENRVALARFLFPMEAKVAMEIAQVNGTCEFTLGSLEPDRLAGAKRTTPELNVVPSKVQSEHLRRQRALSRTVELGKRFFPRCSAKLDQIMDAEDLSQLACIEKTTPEEQRQKKQRYMEIQETLLEAFSEDKKDRDKSSVSSSSSSFASKSIGTLRSNGKLTRRWHR